MSGVPMTESAVVPESRSARMNVVKRNGRKEGVNFNKVTTRITKLAAMTPELDVCPEVVAQKVLAEIYDEVPTRDLDTQAALACVGLSTEHPDQATLAGRIEVSSLHKDTSADFVGVMRRLQEFMDNGVHAPKISEETLAICERQKEVITAKIDWDRDQLIDYFGLKTLTRSQLASIDGRIVERPQGMWMRVAVGIHGDDIESVLATQDSMSEKYQTHATPTLFNAGTPRPQMASCFLVNMKDDSIAGIYDTLGQCASISKWGGGIGLSIHNIRAKGTQIRGTSGKSNGIVPMLRVQNATARQCDQGGGKRKGSFAIQLEPWHADVQEFLEMKLNFGNEEDRARDLFQALWVPDLFMKRVEEDKKWSLMCPAMCPGLADAVGDDFVRLQEQQESEKRYVRRVSARKLWQKILDIQTETGTPQLVQKDAANMKSNQKNLGVIKSSNLCTEIIEQSSPDETAVCNLASLNLQAFVSKPAVEGELIVVEKPECVHCLLLKAQLREWGLEQTSLDQQKDADAWHALFSEAGAEQARTQPMVFVRGVEGLRFIGGAREFIGDAGRPTYDFGKLEEKTREVVRNLNRVIDRGYQPTPETRRSNMRHRPIGIGVQGLADVFARFRVGFASPEAALLNKRIFAHIYAAALEESHRLSGVDGVYETFAGSPASEGIIQPDMWAGVKPEEDVPEIDWGRLRGLARAGLRNSLLVAPMPTASTSQILGNNECFEPFTNNIQTRRVLAGEFIVVNRYLVADLLALGLWNKTMKDRIIAENGSVAKITEIPSVIRQLQPTVWEIKQRVLIDMAADRGRFICQSQSLNLFVPDPTHRKLGAMHFQAWKSGLKTGLQQLRTRPKVDAQKFSIDVATPLSAAAAAGGAVAERKDDDEGCVMCSA